MISQDFNTIQMQMIIELNVNSARSYITALQNLLIFLLASKNIFALEKLSSKKVIKRSKMTNI
jgi:hypothetical protein